MRAVILAVGKGIRLHSGQFRLPGVLREVNGKPMLHYVLEAMHFLQARG